MCENSPKQYQIPSHQCKNIFNKLQSNLCEDKYFNASKPNYKEIQFFKNFELYKSPLFWCCHFVKQSQDLWKQKIRIDKNNEV